MNLGIYLYFCLDAVITIYTQYDVVYIIIRIRYEYVKFKKEAGYKNSM